MLTAGEVWGVVRVGEEQVVGLGHPEVHHLRCVLQSPHRILVHHILQTDIIHLQGQNRSHLVHFQRICNIYANVSRLNVKDKLQFLDRIILLFISTLQV